MKAISVGCDSVLQFDTRLRQAVCSRVVPVGNSVVLVGKFTRRQRYVPARRWYQ